MLYIVNKARQNRILPSVTSKTCRASFPVRAERGEFPRKNHSRLYYPPRKEGKTAAERAGFSLNKANKKASANRVLQLVCYVRSLFCLKKPATSYSPGPFPAKYIRR